MSVGSTTSQSKLTKTPATHLFKFHFYIMISYTSVPIVAVRKVMCDHIFTMAQIIFHLAVCNILYGNQMAAGILRWFPD